eukprot:4304836-Prymnesium_polylepis.2
MRWRAYSATWPTAQAAERPARGHGADRVHGAPHNPSKRRKTIDRKTLVVAPRSPHRNGPLRRS